MGCCAGCHPCAHVTTCAALNPASKTYLATLVGIHAQTCMGNGGVGAGCSGFSSAVYTQGTGADVEGSFCLKDQICDRGSPIGSGANAAVIDIGINKARTDAACTAVITNGLDSQFVIFMRYQFDRWGIFVHVDLHYLVFYAEYITSDPDADFTVNNIFGAGDVGTCYTPGVSAIGGPLPVVGWNGSIALKHCGC